MAGSEDCDLMSFSISTAHALRIGFPLLQDGEDCAMKYLKEQQKNPAGPRKTKPRSLPRASSVRRCFEQFVMLGALHTCRIAAWSRSFKGGVA